MNHRIAVFRGTIRWLANQDGIKKFLRSHSILLKDFTAWAKNRTANIRRSCDHQANELNLETVYLNRSDVNKEELARKIASERCIKTGPICNFSVLETCYVPQIKGNRAKKQMELKIGPSKCIHLYHYFSRSPPH